MVARNPWFVPALVDKAKLMIATNDWEAAMDTVSRILQNDTNNIDAMLLEVINMLVREGRVQNAVKKMVEIKEAMERDEPKTHRLFHSLSQVFCRVSGAPPPPPTHHHRHHHCHRILVRHWRRGQRGVRTATPLSERRTQSRALLSLADAVRCAPTQAATTRSCAPACSLRRRRCGCSRRTPTT